LNPKISHHRSDPNSILLLADFSLFRLEDNKLASAFYTLALAAAKGILSEDAAVMLSESGVDITQLERGVDIMPPERGVDILTPERGVDIMPAERGVDRLGNGGGRTENQAREKQGRTAIARNSAATSTLGADANNHGPAAGKPQTLNPKPCTSRPEPLTTKS